MITQYDLCNRCNRISCKGNTTCGGKLHIPIVSTFKLIELAMAHPTSLNKCLSQFRGVNIKDYIKV